MAQDLIRLPSLLAMVRALLPRIVVNGVLVFVIYLLVKHFTSASDVVALVISAIPAMISASVGLLRQRQVDVLAAFALITIALAIPLTFMTGDPKLFQIRESMFTVLFGLICLVSLLFPKPIWFYIIRYFVTGNMPDQIAIYNTAWQYPLFLFMTRPYLDQASIPSSYVIVL